jgi:hypothetical protein
MSCPSGTFLPPWLSSASTYFAPRFGITGPPPATGKMLNNYIVQNKTINRNTKNLIIQFYLSQLIAVNVIQ